MSAAAAPEPLNGNGSHRNGVHKNGDLRSALTSRFAELEKRLAEKKAAADAHLDEACAQVGRLKKTVLECKRFDEGDLDASPAPA